MFEITLVMQNNEIDIVIPRQLTFGRLRSLLRALFSEHGNDLPENISLNIQGKMLHLKASDWLCDFGVASGEKIEIIIEEGEAANEII